LNNINIGISAKIYPIKAPLLSVSPQRKKVSNIAINLGAKNLIDDLFFKNLSEILIRINKFIMIIIFANVIDVFELPIYLPS
tara:strand:+ start:479 stop:724 length:246 start_codon:yes stop_codon:yes gene_type:complete